MTSPVDRNISRSQDPSEKRGFTLTEIAIVLGIIGLILGAIWVAAGAVYQNLRISKAQTELLQIAQGVRSLYATQSVVDTAAGTDETSALIAAKVFPSDTISSSTVNNGVVSAVNGPWQGSTIKVYSATQPSGITGDSFGVIFMGVPAAACISMTTGNTGTGRDNALWGVTYTTSTTAAAATVTTAPSSTTAMPIYAGTASTSCGSAYASIGFYFALRG